MMKVCKNLEFCRHSVSFAGCKIAATCILKNFVRKFVILNFDLITTLQVTTVVKRIGIWEKTEETIKHYLHTIETKLRPCEKKAKLEQPPFHFYSPLGEAKMNLIQLQIYKQIYVFQMSNLSSYRVSP